MSYGVQSLCLFGHQDGGICLAFFSFMKNDRFCTLSGMGPVIVGSLYSMHARAQRLIKPSVVMLAFVAACQARTREPGHATSVSPSTQASPCAGRTSLDNTDWRRFSDTAIYTIVDTSQCGFQSTPIYTTSIGGNRSHWEAEGATAIYNAGPQQFWVYVNTELTELEAEQRKWHVNWEANVAGKSTQDRCAGQTTAGQTAWLPDGPGRIYVQIDSSVCAFDETPSYFASVGGTRTHSKALGETSIHEPTKEGFRIDLEYPGITPAMANKLMWHINWNAVRRGEPKKALCTGRSGAPDWKPFGKDAFTLKVDTSACGYSEVPHYFTSLEGTTHSRAIGADAIYEATSTGFRVYVKGEGIDPEALFINYKALPAGADIESIGLRRCVGQTEPRGTEWYRFSDTVIYTTMDTSACGHQETPIYTASVGGVRSHWEAEGATAVYDPRPGGFRVYLNTAVTAAEAEEKNWHINWEANAPGATAEGRCSGQTAPGETDWRTDGGPVYVDVDTRSCGYVRTPRYFTSVGGLYGHSKALGETAIHEPTATGFRVYLLSDKMTPERANNAKWHINWNAHADLPPSDEQCTGRAGSPDWKPFREGAWFLDIDSSACNHAKTPNYFTSIEGLNHRGAVGSSAIYQAKKTGFRVYVKGEGIDPDSLFVNWKALKSGTTLSAPLTEDSACAGLTPPMGDESCQDRVRDNNGRFDLVLRAEGSEHVLCPGFKISVPEGAVAVDTAVTILVENDAKTARLAGATVFSEGLEMVIHMEPSMDFEKPLLFSLPPGLAFFADEQSSAEGKSLVLVTSEEPQEDGKGRPLLKTELLHLERDECGVVTVPVPHFSAIAKWTNTLTGSQLDAWASWFWTWLTSVVKTTKVKLAQGYCEGFKPGCEAGLPLGMCPAGVAAKKAAEKKVERSLFINCVAGRLGIPTNFKIDTVSVNDKQPGTAIYDVSGSLTCRALEPSGPLLVTRGGGCTVRTNLSKLPASCLSEVNDWQDAVAEAQSTCAEEPPKKEALDECVLDHIAEPGCDGAFPVVLPYTCLPCEGLYEDWKQSIEDCASATAQSAIKMLVALKECKNAIL